MWSYLKVLIWGALWYPIWLLTLAFRGGRDNCLTYALRKWDSEGGYLVIRWCRSNRVKWIKWPHFLWLSERWHRRLEHVIPDKEHTEKHTLPRPWFEPRVVHGDPKEDGWEEN